MIATTPPATESVPTAVMRCRAAIEYTVDGDLRYLSHHDELRMLSRALVRARWPLAYSQGYNPLLRLVLPLPRRVGIAASGQLALVGLTELRSASDLFAGLAAKLPGDCRLQRVSAPVSRATPHARQATFEVQLTPEDAARVGERLPAVMATSSIVVQRDDRPGKPSQQIDIRPYLDQIELDGPRMRMRLRIQDQRSARPSEVFTEFGLAPEAYNHRLRRCDVQWDKQFAGPRTGPAPIERKPLASQSEDDEESQNHAEENHLR